MMSACPQAWFVRKLRAFRPDRRASSAVEFSIVALPFLLTLLMILQMALYYMTQSALDAGMIQEADSLVNTFYTTNIPTAPSVSTLQTQIAQSAGGLIQAATLKVDLQPLQNLATAPVAIGLNPPNIGSTRGLLALRAQANVTAFMPGIPVMVVRSSTVIRRQNY